MRFRLDDVVRATGGSLADPPGDREPGGRAGAGEVDGASIDSRAVPLGGLFVAVVAERDGHDFVGAAATAGAAAALVSRPVEASVPQVVVADTVVALAALGSAARGRIEGPVVGITGSVGKTSTKDLLAAICALAGPTTASERSLNNEMGVPLTLVNAAPDTVRTIVEMGARGAGHIAQLCVLARPTIGVVTAVAAAHTELFGTVDDVAVAKGELVEALPPSGVAVLNADDHRVIAMAPRTSARVLSYGRHGVVTAEQVEIGDDLRPRFVLRSDWGAVEVHLGVRGAHNVSNALAAAGTALVTDVPLDQVAAGLGAADLSPSRMHLVRAPSGGLVLDDAYNANPASMRAALESLAHLDVRRRVAVVGLMAELGPSAAEEHREIAALAGDLGIELVAVGTDLYGVEPYAGVDELVAAVAPPVDGEAVLLRASRIAGLDRVARRWTHGDPPAR